MPSFVAAMALVAGPRSPGWDASQVLEEPRPRGAGALAYSQPGDRNGLGRQLGVLSRGPRTQPVRESRPRLLGADPPPLLLPSPPSAAARIAAAGATSRDDLLDKDQEEKKTRKKSLVIQKKDPRKGGRKSHLRENTRSTLTIVTATLILTQTPVVQDSRWTVMLPGVVKHHIPTSPSHLGDPNTIK
ncbi:uncharacterized protein LOC129534857 isoform X2 [Moschus berezovskii]|uniref:uncharacterized protein LOC129534857 isoform X2 n=1 Tax=Moschus berezovskii TaxID=68408 RepID=UPI002443ABE8|nr:uncharacterized protein LOC129534857 isoform X2 [Moschus berezovskii]